MTLEEFMALGNPPDPNAPTAESFLAQIGYTPPPPKPPPTLMENLSASAPEFDVSTEGLMEDPLGEIRQGVVDPIWDAFKGFSRRGDYGDDSPSAAVKADALGNIGEILSRPQEAMKGGLEGLTNGSVQEAMEKAKAGWTGDETFEWGFDEPAYKPSVLGDRPWLAPDDPKNFTSPEGQEFATDIVVDPLAPLAATTGATLGKIQKLFTNADAKYLDEIMKQWNLSNNPESLLSSDNPAGILPSHKTGQEVEVYQPDLVVGKNDDGLPVAENLGAINPIPLRPNVNASEATKGGLPPDLLGVINRANPETREIMSKIVENQRVGVRVPETPTNITDPIGEVVDADFRQVLAHNRHAGSKIDEVVKSPEFNMPIDLSPISQSISKQFNELGITLDPLPGGGYKPNFANSKIQGIPAMESQFNRLVDKMNSLAGRPASAREMHELKKWFDYNIDYGKAVEGLDAGVAHSLKSIRHDIDATLDNLHPEYDKWNSIYAETIEPINDLQSIAGTKVDLTQNADQALGRLARRIAGNAQSSELVANTLVELQRLANELPRSKNYGEAGEGLPAIYQGIPGIKNGDVGKGSTINYRSLLDLVNRLEGVYGKGKHQSLGGNLQTANDQVGIAQMAMSGDPTMTTLAAVNKYLGKKKGANPEELLDLIRKLTGQQ